MLLAVLSLPTMVGCLSFPILASTLSFSIVAAVPILEPVRAGFAGDDWPAVEEILLVPQCIEFRRLFLDFCIAFALHLELGNLRLQQGKASFLILLLIQGCHYRTRQKLLSLSLLELSHYLKIRLIGTTAFGASIVVRHPPLEPHAIPAPKFLSLVKGPKCNRIQLQPVALQVDGGTANGLAVPSADLRRSFDDYNCLGFARIHYAGGP